MTGLGAEQTSVRQVLYVRFPRRATRVVVWQLSQEMERQGITKAALAEGMHTSRAQVDRILKAKGNVTIETLQRAAALVGRELRLELV